MPITQMQQKKLLRKNASLDGYQLGFLYKAMKELNNPELTEKIKKVLESRKLEILDSARENGLNSTEGKIAKELFGVRNSKDIDKVFEAIRKSTTSAKVFAYHGRVITASSKKEAIQQIVADSKKPEIDMKVVNKWAKKNMNITDKGLGKDHWKDEKTGEVYYSWEAAKRLAKKVPGFHLPTAEEWNQLAEACGGICDNPEVGKTNHGLLYDNIQELKKKLGIKLVGWYHPSNKDFFYVGSHAVFWTSTDGNKILACYRNFDAGDGMGCYYERKSNGHSVRLVKD